MAKAREVRKRMKAVANIRRITKTMQMIATSKFARAQQRALATKPFTEGIFDLVRELAAKAGNISHPLINGPSGGPKGGELLLVITSDRGLCGPYNGNVLRAARDHVRKDGSKRGELPQGLSLEIVGKKGIGFLRFAGIPISRQLTQFGDKPAYADVEKLGQEYMDRFTKGEVSAVRIAFMRYISTSRQRPEILQLLPLKPPAAGEGAAGEGKPERTVQYEFSPDPERLLADLLPLSVKATLFQCFNDAIVSEHVSRMIAMKAATDNAGKMGKVLQRRYNRARQSQITTELTEIVSGAAALE